MVVILGNFLFCVLFLLLTIIRFLDVDFANKKSNTFKMDVFWSITSFVTFLMFLGRYFYFDKGFDNVVLRFSILFIAVAVVIMSIISLIYSIRTIKR